MQDRVEEADPPDGTFTLDGKRLHVSPVDDVAELAGVME